MKEAMWGYMIVVLGLIVAVVMIVIRDYQTSNDQDYYLIKEITAAAMTDAVDYGYYREHNDVRIIEEKFVENFLRRFAESMNSTKTYQIEMFRVSETPPLATIKVITATGTVKVKEDIDAVDFGVVTLLTGVLEMKYNNTVYYDNYTYYDATTPNTGAPQDEEDDISSDDYNLDGTLPTCNATSGTKTTFSPTSSVVSYQTYQQYDSDWKNVTFNNGSGNTTINSGGGMLTALATVLSGYDSSITPQMIVNYGLGAENPSFVTSILGGSGHGIECGPYQANGTTYATKTSILNSLKDGNPAIIEVKGSANGGASKFTNTTQALALLDYKVISGVEYVYVGNSFNRTSAYGVAGWYPVSDVFTSVTSMNQCFVSTDLLNVCR